MPAEREHCGFVSHPRGPCEGARYEVRYIGTAGVVLTACVDWARTLEGFARVDGDKNDRMITSLDNPSSPRMMQA